MAERFSQHRTFERLRWEREVSFTTGLIDLIQRPEIDARTLTNVLEAARVDQQTGMKIAERVLKSSWDLDTKVAPTALLPLVVNCQKLKKKGQDLDAVLNKAKAVLSKKI